MLKSQGNNQRHFGQSQSASTQVLTIRTQESRQRLCGLPAQQGFQADAGANPGTVGVLAAGEALGDRASAPEAGVGRSAIRSFFGGVFWSLTTSCGFLRQARLVWLW